MTLIVDGKDLSPFIALNGYSWQRSDVDGPNSGRSLENAYLYRDRLATKTRLDITCRPLSNEEISFVLNAIYPEYVTVTYTDPQIGADVTKEMYSNNIPASHILHKKNGNDLWGGVTFPLIER